MRTCHPLPHPTPTPEQMLQLSSYLVPSPWPSSCYQAKEHKDTAQRDPRVMGVWGLHKDGGGTGEDTVLTAARCEFSTCKVYNFTSGPSSFFPPAFCA